MPLSVYYDFTSPYSYLTLCRIGPSAAALGVEVACRPILLGPLFQAAGLSGSPNLSSEAKAAYMWRDLERRAARLGVPFVKPERFPMRSVTAARMALAAPPPERLPLSRAIAAEAFGHGTDIADPSVLERAATSVELNGAALLDTARTDDIKAGLRDAVEAARAAGVFGAPTFITHQGELFWGDDALSDALHFDATGRLGPQP